jgi:hypothetical protein
MAFLGRDIPGFPAAEETGKTEGAALFEKESVRLKPQFGSYAFFM